MDSFTENGGSHGRRFSASGRLKAFIFMGTGGLKGGGWRVEVFRRTEDILDTIVLTNVINWDTF